MGFGRSDKPAQQKDHSYSRHVQWMTLFLESLDLQRMTLMCQDWGGLIGLRLVAEHGARFDRVLAANTMLPGFPMFKPEVKAVFGIKAALQTTLAFGSWLSYSQFNPSWQAGQILQFGTAHKLTQPEIDAYNAPFPDRSYMAGARVFPRLVPTDRQANIVAWRALRQWQKPFLCAFSDRDPIMSKMTGVFPALIPGCRGQAHTTIGKAGHFLQDDQGEPLAGVLNAFIANTPS